MTCLDTGCLVKLYYPQMDSPRVIALVRGRPIFFTPLHELKMTNALQLKVSSKSATAVQTTAARALVAADLQSGVLVFTDGQWKEAFAAKGSLPEDVNCAVNSGYLLGFLESVPEVEVSAKLKEPQTARRRFEDVLKNAEQADVLVLLYRGSAKRPFTPYSRQDLEDVMVRSFVRRAVNVQAHPQDRDVHRGVRYSIRSWSFIQFQPETDLESNGRRLVPESRGG
ncbi:MAG: hypothetical protein EXS31_07090 [Pedosphaera sp.]|nr:hypothetical protein [Pedosphaera sp.]